MLDLEQHLADASQERRGYVLRHLPRHLANSKEVDRLYFLLTDTFFLESKTQGISIFDLAADFTRAAEITPDDHRYHGIFKLLVHKETREILGAHVVGAEATELIHEILLAKTAELLPEDIAVMTHAHPTLSEGVMEMARMAEGWAIHV